MHMISRRSSDNRDAQSPTMPGQMRRYAVSARVNNVANDDRECSEPTEVPRAIQTGLF